MLRFSPEVDHPDDHGGGATEEDVAVTAAATPLAASYKPPTLPSCAASCSAVNGQDRRPGGRPRRPHASRPWLPRRPARQDRPARSSLLPACRRLQIKITDFDVSRILFLFLFPPGSPAVSPDPLPLSAATHWSSTPTSSSSSPLSSSSSAASSSSSAAFSPWKQPEILSPRMLDLPSLALSPVTPLIPDPSNRSPHPNSTPSSAMSAEERAIAEKGFYLHPSRGPRRGTSSRPGSFLSSR